MIQHELSCRRSSSTRSTTGGWSRSGSSPAFLAQIGDHLRHGQRLPRHARRLPGGRRRPSCTAPSSTASTRPGPSPTARRPSASPRPARPSSTCPTARSSGSTSTTSRSTSTGPTLLPLRAGPGHAGRHVRPRGALGDAGGQAGPDPLAAAGLVHRAPPGRDPVRGDRAQRPGAAGDRCRSWSQHDRSRGGAARRTTRGWRRAFTGSGRWCPEGRQAAGLRVVAGLHHPQQPDGAGLRHGPRPRDASAPYTTTRSLRRATAARSSSRSTPSRASRSRLTKFLTYHTSRQPSPAGEQLRPGAADARPGRPPRVRAAAARTSGRTWTTSGSAATSRSPAGAPAAAAVPPLEPVPAAPGDRPGRRHAGVPAKGLTGQAYEGHYFWDMEIYVDAVPDLHRPAVARNLLMFRHGMLDKARERARELNQKGRPVPLADDQRRGGQRLLRRRHRPVPHQRRHRLRAEEVRRGHRATRSSSRLRRRDPRRDGPALVRPGLLLRPAGRQVLHPRRHRARRVHHRRQQQHLHQPDGPGEPLVRGRRSSSGCATSTREHYAALVARAPSSTPARPPTGSGPPTTCTCPTTSGTRINPQDDSFLDREVWDFKNTPEGQVPAAAALPPAGHLPPPGDQAGRHRAGDVPARQRVLAGAEEAELRLLRPAHDRRLVAVGLHPEHRRRRDRLRRRRPSSTCATPC